MVSNSRGGAIPDDGDPPPVKVYVMSPARRVPASAHTLKHTSPVAIYSLDCFWVARLADKTDGTDHEMRAFVPTLSGLDVLCLDVVLLCRIVPRCTDHAGLEGSLSLKAIPRCKALPIGK